MIFNTLAPKKRNIVSTEPSWVKPKPRTWSPLKLRSLSGAGKNWSAWNAAIAPAVAARRRCLQLLGDKQAVRVLFDEVAPRFTDRPGGYTRIVRLAKPRLGDAGTRVILEFVGVRDRVVERSVRPTFEGEATPAGKAEKKAVAAE